MTGSQTPNAGATDLRAVAEDWITIVQSELAALATDREAGEIAKTMLAIWAKAATAMVAGDAGPAGSPRAAPAAAASAAGRDELAALHRRIDELERLVAELGQRNPGSAGKPAGGRKSRRNPRGGTGGSAGEA